MRLCTIPINIVMNYNGKIKEIEDYFEGWEDHSTGCALNPEGEAVTVDEIKEIAYHFYFRGKEKDL